MFLGFGTIVNAQTTWYLKNTGDWNVATNWTQDPAAAVTIPSGGGIPDTNDNVVIPSGKTVSLTEDNALTFGSVSIYGDLDLSTFSINAISVLKGNGRLLLAANNYPTITDDSDFISIDEDAGTIVLYGNSFSFTGAPTFCNLEIDMTSGQTLSLESDLTLNGNLTISTGELKINNGGTTALNVTVNGDVSVESSGIISVGTGAAFHWMNVYGDFVNNGSVDFTNSAQYVEATDGAVKLKFLGEADNDFVCNNTTALYRLFVDKGTDKTYKISVTADDNSNFTLNGPVDDASYSGLDGSDGSSGYQRLPIVLENGTLELGANIVIDRLGENIDGSAPNGFAIPETTQLTIDGANITTSSSAGDWNGVVIYGKLKISAGLLTTPSGSDGILYATNGSAPIFEATGGIVQLTQLRPYNNADQFIYNQSGGLVHFFAESNNSYYSTLSVGTTNGNTQPASLNTDYIFNMSDGDIRFDVANSGNNWITGIRLEVNEGNYNVTGGTVSIYEPSSYPFEIYTTVPFYNLSLFDNGGNPIHFTNSEGGQSYNTTWSSDFEILNNLTISNGATFNDNGHTIYLGGDLLMEGTFDHTGSMILDGAKDALLTNNTGSDFTFGSGTTSGIVINKDPYPVSGQFYTVSLEGANGISINGNLNIQRGAFDVGDFEVGLSDSLIVSDGDLSTNGTGGILFNSSSKVQYIQGNGLGDQNFGRLIFKNTYSSSPNIALLSDVLVNNVEFPAQDTAQVVYIGSYNLKIEEPDFVSWGWNTTSTQYFETTGTSSDKGLTLPVNITAKTYTNELVQLFPIAAGGYAPSGVYIDGVQTALDGYLTVKPIEGDHPAVSNASKATDYYWRIIQEGLDVLDGTDLSYKMYCPATISSSYNALMVLSNNAWYNDDGSESGNVISYSNIDGSNSYIEGDYTIGSTSGFNSPRILYSRMSGFFNVEDTWSDDPVLMHDGNAVGNNQEPNSYDICIIGGNSTTGNHIVTINANDADAAQLYIKGDSETSLGGSPPTLVVNTGTSGHDIDVIDGNGKLKYINDVDYGPNNLINGDHSGLCSSDESIVEFAGTGSYWMPANTKIASYPNLVISGGGTKHTPYQGSVYIAGDLTVDDADFSIVNIYNGVLSIGDSLKINTGTLTLSGQSNHHTEIEGSIVFTGAGTLQGGNAENKVYLKGDIDLVDGSAINFNSSNIGNVEFEGDDNALVSIASGTASVDFNRIYINKTVGQNVQFDVPFTLNGSTTDATKSLVMLSGECILNNSGIDIDLTTGGNDFEIPYGTKLYITDGIVNASGNSGVKLDGSLIVNGGTANIDGTVANPVGTSNSSYIEFTSSGDSYLEVSSSGILNVGDQVRRSISLDEGILTFVQDGGIVNIGTVGDDLTNTRGMFEILGAGSSFSQADADVITIERSNGSTVVPTLYFDPETVTYGAGSGVTIDGSSVTAETFVLYANQNLNDFTISGGTGNIAQLKTVAHTIDGTLTIGASTTFDANGLDLYINEDYVNNGTYTSSNNTIYFNGSSDQSISGSGTNDFNNLVLNSGNTLSSGSDLTITNDLTITSGTLSTGTNVVNIEGDVINNGTTISASGDGIILNSISGSQTVAGSGSYQNLTIDNADGVVMPSQSSAITITGTLKLEDGIFDIGRNLMEITNGAVFDPGTTYSGDFTSANMIQTNLSFTDAGINKTFNNDEIGSFIYPVGSFGLYTPVAINVVANGNSTGSIRVKAANEPHITISGTDLDHVLQYNWTLDADGITGFQGEISMQADPSDEVGITSNYVGVRFELGGTEVNLYDQADDYDETNHLLNIDFNKTDVYLSDADIDGDYTAGESSVTYDVKAFISVSDGDWTTGSTWDYYDPDTETTTENGSAFPNGAIVYIANGTTVTMSTDERIAYAAYLNPTGRLDVGTSLNHRLGNIYGTGTLAVESNSLPTGVYTDFCSASGGTIEYYGSFSAYVLAETSVVNNLTLKGSGIKSLPNYPTQGVTVYGDLVLDGPTLKAYVSQDLNVEGDIVFTSGSFDANGADVIFNGSSLQNVSGALNFTSADGGEFYNLEINNISGVTMSNDLEVSNNLNLTDGVVFTDAGGSLLVSNTLSTAITGGSESSYVQGPLSKYISDSDNFTFPLGDQNRYMPIDVDTDGIGGGSETWKAQYFSHNPDDDGFDVSSLTGSVAYVSHGEYWSVYNDNNQDAMITLNWDDLSGVNPDDPDFRVVEWSNLATDAWSEISVGSPVGTSSSGSVQSSGYITFNEFTEGNYFTFGSISIPAYTWEGDESVDWFTAGNWSSSLVPGASSNVTIPNGTYGAEIDGSASVNGLTITTGTLTLKPGAQLTVNGDLTTNNSMTIENTVASPASVIVEGNVTGNTTEEWPLTERVWWYIGHSVTGVTESEYETAFPGDTYALNRWIDSWERIAGIGEDAGDYVFGDELEGYSLILQNAGTLSYSGVLNNGDYGSTDLDARFHLVANPYPSYIDVEEAGFDIGDFEKTIYIRKSNDEISTYNILTNEGLLEGSRYIAPGQCMWLTTETVLDAISISSSVRTHSSEGYGLKSVSTAPDDRLRLSLQSAYGVDETVVIFNEYGSELNTDYDSPKVMNSGNLANIYSIKEGDNIAINSLPNINSDEIVPLGYQVDTSGLSEFTIEATNISDFESGVDVYLIDNEKDAIVNLREVSTYTFTASATEANDRFELRFEASISTDIDESESAVSNRNVQIYSVNQKAIVKVTDEVLQGNDRQIEVYDVAGQLVNYQELNSSETELELPQANTMYIINVRVDKSSYQRKVISMK